MKILLVINSIRISGSEKLMLALSKELSRSGYEFWIYPLITPFDDDFRKSIETDGFRLNILVPGILLRNDRFFWRLNGLFTRLFKWNFRAWYMNRYVARKCQEIGIDLMVSNSYTTDLLTAQIHDKTGLPYIIVEHGAYSFFLITNEAFDETPITKSLGVVAVSRWTERLLRSRFPQKQTTTILNALVPDAVADNQTFRLSPGPFTFCMHGRDTEQKGWELAIRSFLKFRDAGFNARLVLLCAGPYIDSLKSRYHDREDIIFGGFVYNIGEAIAQVDAGLMLSKHSEAFGLSILDYFSKGKPVIAGKVGGIEEVMIADDLSGGILVNADNGIPRENEVVEAMKRLTMEKETYSAMSRDAKQIVKKFDLKSCADAYDRLFKSAVGK